MLDRYVVFVKDTSVSAHEFPFCSFVFDFLEEAESFKTTCLTYTHEDLMAVREFDNPDATEEEVKAFVENQKIGIMPSEEYFELREKYLNSSLDVRKSISEYLNTKVNNNKEVK